MTNELTSLNQLEPVGVYRIFTASGSAYLLTLEGKPCDGRTVRLSREARGVTHEPALADPSHPLRRDGEELLVHEFSVKLGAAGIFILHGLGTTSYTVRQTTVVMGIEFLGL